MRNIVSNEFIQNRHQTLSGTVTCRYLKGKKKELTSRYPAPSTQTSDDQEAKTLTLLHSTALFVVKAQTKTKQLRRRSIFPFHASDTWSSRHRHFSHHRKSVSQWREPVPSCPWISICGRNSQNADVFPSNKISQNSPSTTRRRWR